MSEKSDYFFAVLDLNLSNEQSPSIALYNTVESYEEVFQNFDRPAEMKDDAGVRTHRLKTWPEYFQAVLDRTKRFELRQNDRDFRSGDILKLEEYDQNTGKYTGRIVFRKITFLVQGVFGLPENICVMSIE